MPVFGPDEPPLTPSPRLAVPLPGPLDLPASLEVFRRSGDDLIDRWDGTHLVRTVPVGGRSVAFAATASGTLEQPVLHVKLEDPSAGPQVAAAIGASFVAAPPEFVALLDADPVLAHLNGLFPGVRPVLQLDLLTALVRCISAQQVNLRWAVTTRRRLAEAFGERHTIAGHVVYSLSAPRLAAAAVAEIRDLQFTTRKAEYLVGIGEALASGRLDLATLAALPDDEIVARLTALRGIGLWTAEWVLARTLGRPRVVAGDLGVRKAVGLAYLGTPLPPEPAVREATAHWGPAAAVAQTVLLHALGQGALDV